MVAEGSSDAKTVAKNLGINSNVLYRWVSAARKLAAKTKLPKAKSVMTAKRSLATPVASEFELTELRRLNVQYKQDIAALRHTIGLLTREA